MKNWFLGLIGVIGFVDASVSQIDTFKLMQYNLLQYPALNNTKAVELNTILEFYNPDIITVNEMTSEEAIELIYEAVDTTKYKFGPYYPDAFISNGLFFNKQKLGLSSSFAFQSFPRKTHVYKLYNINQDFFLHPDTVYLNVGVVHFKSSQGSSNENVRYLQAIDITDYLRVFNPSNFILSGDYNMYTSNEDAYQELIAEADNYLIDPIARPGTWHNNSSFADIHTQSPRTTSFDGGVTGGMDDRFDIVLLNNEIMNGTGGVTFIDGSYSAPGNDGQHFNSSILASPVNTSAPQEIIQALHAMSDHLPVILDLRMDPSNVTTASKNIKNQNNCCELGGKQELENSTQEVSIYAMTGINVWNGLGKDILNLNLNQGLYFIKYKDESNNCNCMIKLLIMPDGQKLFSL